jgi:fructuronate reductase
MNETARPRLNRTNYKAGPRAPVRSVHLGLGAFHRAHQAWYTNEVDAAHEWGIAAFTGRSPEAANILSRQDGLYTLIQRSGEGDTWQVIESIVEANDGANLARLTELVGAKSTAIITLTVTEAAYYLSAQGGLNFEAAPVAADLEILRRNWRTGGTGAGGRETPSTAAARLIVALEARRKAGAGPIALISCDNLTANGTVARYTVSDLAQAVSPELGKWTTRNVSFVGTSIDRITPKTTAAELEWVAENCGFEDASPVVTEPFHSWVLSGDFPAGRPRWEDAGAQFVEQIEPYENRKLWLLNGSHSLLAYAGQQRGHHTVAEAVADPQCAKWMEAFWDEAQAHLPAELDIPSYRAALRERYSNARIAHNLAQIAIDGSSKLPIRAIPVLRAEREAGRDGSASARPIAAWIAFLQSAQAAGNKINDAGVAEVNKALSLGGRERTKALVGLLDRSLAEDKSLLELIDRLVPSHMPETSAK